MTANRMYWNISICDILKAKFTKCYYSTNEVLKLISQNVTFNNQEMELHATQICCNEDEEFYGILHY